MGWFGNIAGKIRSWIDKDETHVQRRAARGVTNERFPTQQRDIFGYQGMADWLTVDRDLMSRFRDYEDMDEYPEIASAIDIFADDATQTDSVTNRTMWITSSDKRIQEILDDELLQKRLIIDEEIWEIARTLVKYGNDYEEILLGPDGVVGFNFLPPATVRRVEDSKGNLLGFLQDFKERFQVAPDEFLAMLKKQMGGRPPSEDPNDPNFAMAALEDWEVIHFRLRSKYRRSVYGFCLTGDSRVWTPLGVKRLDEVQPGDVVYTRHAGMLRTTKVLDHVCSGTKPIFRLKTTHREVRLTAEHPMLVDRGGKNNAWVPVGELRVGDKLVAVSSQPETLGPVPLGIRLRELTEDSLVRLTSKGVEALKTRNRPVAYAPTSWGLRPVASGMGISKGMLDELLDGRSSLPLDYARVLFRGVGLPLFDGAFQVVEDPRLMLPDFVDPKFAMLLGFLLGDGWVHGDQVCFALETDEEHNQFYEAFFESYGLETSRSKDSDGVDRTSYVTCKKLVEVFAGLGWAGEKAHEKRVPSWMYAQSREIREAFLQGFLDADGWETDNGYEHTELCNEALVRDLKMLVDGLGWTCGNVCRREARTSELKNGKKIHSGPTFTISFKRTPLSNGDFAFERVESIESDGEEAVYDIEVADRAHCFVADGLVVHNSVLEPARWIWKRLTILEDTAILFRLTKAVERFAFYIDVGDMPPAEALAYVNRVRQQYRKKKYVNPTTGKLELRFDALCLHENTEVPLLDGTVRTVRAMAEAYARGEDQWVWSVDLGDAGRLRPGKVEWAGQTRVNAQLVRVVLDNGEHVIVTPDHKMIRRDGMKVQAQELRPGDSLMPFRRRVSTKVRGDQLEGYELVYCPKTHKSVYGHRVVAEDLGLKASGQLTHHVDFDPLNNAPWNLLGMFYRDHLELHRQLGFNGGEALKRCRAEDPELDRRCRDASSRNIVQYNQSESKRKFLAEWNKGRDQGRFIREYNASDRHAEDNVIRSKTMQGMWSDPERREQACKNMRVKFPTSFVEGVKELVRQNPEATADEIAEAAFDTLRDILQEVNTRKIVSVHRHMLLKMVKEEGYENFDGFRRAAIRDNAEVVSVDWLETPADTFTLTVGETHTFALQAGIFVCNSQDEDFFVPSRGGQEGTRIDVVGAPQWQCLVGSTRVPLLDGTEPTLAELADREGEFWVYSVDKVGHVVPGKARSARMTQASAEIWEITLDNGEVIRCTGNHPFLSRDGKWILAEHLRDGDSLMPLYRKVSSHGAGDKIEGYEKVYDPADESWPYTHHVSFGLEESDLKAFFSSGNVIHHKNFDKHDNTPQNLQGLSRADHSSFHSVIGKNSWEDPVRRENHRKMMVSRMSDKVLRADKARILAEWNRSEDHRSRIRGDQHPRWNGATLADLEYLVLATGARGIRELMRWGRIGQSVIHRILRTEGLTWSQFAERNIPGWAPKGRALGPNNHKVASVLKTSDTEPVFCLTVDEHANFAIGQGVFVSNSMDDIEYFRDKMFSSLKVPKSYLGHEAGVARAVLSSEDVRFARTVLRVQRELKNGIRKVGKIHLMAKGVDPGTTDFEVWMTVPSAIFELAQLEVRNARADLAARMNDFVSMPWILKNVFGLPGEDIEVILRERGEDAVRTLVAQGKGEAEAQKLIAASVPAMPGGGEAEAEEVQRRMAVMQERIRNEARARGYGSLSFSKEELRKRDPLAERRASDKLDAILRSDKEMASRLDNVAKLLRDLAITARPSRVEK